MSDNEYHSYEVIAAAVLKLPFSTAVCGMLFVDSDTDLLGLSDPATLPDFSVEDF